MIKELLTVVLEIFLLLCLSVDQVVVLLWITGMTASTVHVVRAYGTGDCRALTLSFVICSTRALDDAAMSRARR